MTRSRDVANIDTILTTKGDIYAASAAYTPTRLGVGSNNQVLSADSAETTGLKWVPGSGLAYISKQTFSASSGVSLNNVFSSTYTAYRIVCSNVVGSTSNNLSFRLRASGTDNSTASSYNFRGTYIDTAVNLNSAANNFMNIIDGYTSTVPSFASIDIGNPFLATETQFTWIAIARNTPRTFMNAGWHNQAVSYDGFTVYPGSGTVSGTVTVYGYKE